MPTTPAIWNEPQFGEVTFDESDSGPAPQTLGGAGVYRFNAPQFNASFPKLGASALTLTLAFTTLGQRTALGSSSLDVTFGFSTVGKRTAFGSSSLDVTVGFSTLGNRTVFGSSATAINFGFTTVGRRTVLGASALPLVLTFTTSGTGGGGAVATAPQRTLMGVGI